jgi:ribosome recycling factor
MAMDDILLEVEEKMTSATDYFRLECRGIRTGRASAGLVDHIKVEYYGSPTDMRQLAAISTPDASMIVIKPFDPSTTKDIERAIQASDLGITPSTDGRIIRLSVPPLSMERRTQLVSQVRKMAEAARVSIRNARRDGNKEADKQQKTSELTEDDAKKGKDDIQELTKQYEAKITEVLDAKSTEIEET